jgi:hypothetical protein
MTAYFLARNHPRAGWAVAIAIQPLWAFYGWRTGALSFVLSAPVYMFAFTRLMLRDMRTRKTPPQRPSLPCDTCALYILAEYERECILADADR